MKVLSLFSGGGLGDYGLELAGMEIVGQVEIDEYCQKILKLRWPNVPKWKDIREFNWQGAGVDLISGGFPCQPFSVAGKREGAKDERDLWHQMFRVICEVRPKWVLAENVPGLLSISSGRKFGEVLGDLASVGYCVEWDCIPASAVGAPHRRDRVWIVANTRLKPKGTKSRRIDRQSVLGKTPVFGSSEGNRFADSGEVENAEFNRLEEPRNRVLQGWPPDSATDSSWWTVEPNVGRVAHGVPSRVDRLKLLGNGQVVQVVEWIGKQILNYEN